MGKLKLPIVGCGATAELGHLLGTVKCPDVEVTVLDDKFITRA
jgi:hypothetical protein